MEKLYLSAIAALLLVPPSVQAKTWIVADARLEVRFDDRNATFQVKDKRAHKTWKQAPLQDPVRVERVTQNGKRLSLKLRGKFPFEAELALNDASALEVSIRAAQDQDFDTLPFPAAFKAPNQHHYLLQTNSDGVLIPMADRGYPLEDQRIFFCGGGLAMPWMGVTDFQFKTGYMAIIDTPFDARLVPFREDGQVRFKPSWQPSMGKFGYERKLHYVFFDQGGYVAQAKTYRDYIWKKNGVQSLKQRAQRTPDIDKMIGAVHIYLWNDARETSFLHDLKASGIDRAFVLWDPNHKPYPEPGYDLAAKELGYASGAYDLFTDLQERDKTLADYKEGGKMRHAPRYPGKFDQLVLRTRDGGSESNQFGHTISPAVVRPEIISRLDGKFQEYPHEALLLDVWAANGLFEDYSPDHRLSRQQFAEQVIQNYQLVADRYKVYLGGEWGADYLSGQLAFAHGMMTLQRTWWNTPGVDTKGSIHWTGDWKDHEAPSQMVGTRTANLSYVNYSINETIRVPLYELVYHDAIVTSWRWEDGNHHTPELWWKKDLFNMLYGTAPLWSIDRQRFEAHRQTFIDSARTVTPWLRQIGYDELVSHRFLTSDRHVQESVFSSGKRIIVNFGDSEVTQGGQTIPARGFLIR